MNRPIAIVGAPTSIGIKPYENGEPRALDRAPGVYRQLGLVSRVGAEDSGDVRPLPYRDFTRPSGRPRNESEMVSYNRELAERVGTLAREGRFVLVLGGDCSIVLGSLLGLRRASAGRMGLAYIDGHADFATPAESRTGSVASMCLGLAVGRSESPLARLLDDGPLVHPEHVALVGRRDEHEPWYGHDALHASQVLDLPQAKVGSVGYRKIVTPVLQRVGQAELDGFWIHVDADVLDPAVMPAVDSPEPGGPDLNELAQLLAPLVSHPKAMGMEITIYDPKLDSDFVCGRRLVELLEQLLAAS
jgi:arginase